MSWRSDEMSKSGKHRESTTPERFPWESAVTRRAFLHRSAALGGSLSLAGLLAACGGDEEAGPAGGTGTSAGKDTITVAHFSDMQNLDPHTSSADTATQEVLTNIYDVWLTYRVPGTEQDGVDWANVNEFKPWAAESWEYNADKTELTFTLRDGLKFADGSPLTADAVKFTTDRMFDIQAVASFLFAIVGITKKNQLEVVDKRRFKL